MRKHAQAGFTLLEVTITGVVMGTIVAITMSIVLFSQNYARTEIALTHFHYKAQTYTDQVMTPLLDAKIERAYEMDSYGNVTATHDLSVFPIQGGIDCIEFKRVDKNNPMDAEGNVQWSANSFYVRFLPLEGLYNSATKRLKIQEVGPYKVTANTINVAKDLNLDQDNGETYVAGVLQIAEGTTNNPGGVNWKNLWQNDELMVALYPIGGDMFIISGNSANQVAKRVNIQIIYFDRINNCSMPIFDNITIRNAQ